jgi:ribosome-associated heat shock protein Hsp15
MESVRVDRWLYAARIFKTRTLSTQSCVGGKVRIDGQAVKPSHPVRVGHALHVQSPGGLRILEVRALAERRLSAPLARELYEDHSPPPPPREERGPRRPRGAGRPTKREGRAVRKLRRPW